MDEFYMNIAIEEAKKGKGMVNPNPLVGAVIVKGEKIISKGYHERYGEGHAEVNAFKNAKEKVQGGTMYVTLEPCSHYGKTPPCAEKIIDMKIKKVVVGMLDPNPLVSGRGIKKLEDAGVEVICGVLEDECKKLNEVFIKFITKNTPFVVLKTGMSIDGKIATKYGESRWITGEKSREYVHQLRNELIGIMVGVNTVIQDNPSLDCRLEGGRNPIKIIVDSSLRIPLNSKIITNEPEKTIIATTEKASKDKMEELKAIGVKILILPLDGERVDLNELMIILGEMKIDGILLEGGGTLNYSFLEKGLVDKVLTFISPKIIGGSVAKTPVEGSGIEKLSSAYKLLKTKITNLGEDFLIEGYLEGGEG